MIIARVPFRVGVAAAALLAAAGAITVSALPAHAAATTRYVAVTGDDTDNDCTDHAHPCQTIGYAISQANSGDTVSIAAGTYDESVRIRESLTLLGAGTSGSAKTTIDGDSDADPSITVDGIDTDTTPDVTIRQLDVSGNSDSDGIFVEAAAATIDDSVVSNNSANGVNVTTSEEELSRVGARAAAAGSPGSVALSDDELSHNGSAGLTATGATISADHLSVANDTGGGLITSGGTATISASTFDANSGAGLGVFESGAATLTRSTVSNTVTSDEEGGFGSGVLGFLGATVTVSESTLYSNSGQGVLSLISDVTVRNSTVSHTQSVSGESLPLPNAALANVNSLPPSVARAADRDFATSARTRAIADAPPEGSALTAVATLVAGNQTPDCTSDGSGSGGITPTAITDGGYNLSDDNSCGFTATGSKNNGVGKLGPFGAHGGPTKTVVPEKGSDAIDKIPSGKAGCSTDATDQRGDSRLQGNKCDIGAVEVAQPPLIVKPAHLPHGKAGHAYRVQLTATGGLGAPYSFSVASGTLPHGLTLSSEGLLSGTPTQSGTFHFTVAVDDPVFKHYVLVIAAPASSSAPSSAAPSTQPASSAPPVSPSNSAGPLANTGARVAPLLTFGGVAVGLGLLLLFAGAFGARRKGGNRPAH